MATPFEIFVNNEIPTTIRTTIPPSGNLEAGKMLVTTGVGLNVTTAVAGSKESGSYYVSATDPLANYSDLGTAIIAAKAAATTISNGIFNIYVDSGTYSISNIDLTSVGVDNVAIRIIGVGSYGEQNYTDVSSQTLSNTKITLDFSASADFIIKCRYTYFLFEKVMITTSVPALSDLTHVAFNIYSGGLWFIESRVTHICAPTSGLGKIVFTAPTAASGIFFSVVKSYFRCVLTGGSSVGQEFNVVDFSTASHPYIIIEDSMVFTQLGSDNHYTIFNAKNTDSSTTPWHKITNSYFRLSCTGSVRTLTLLKASASGSTIKPNIFEKNTFVGAMTGAPTYGGIILFDYDTVLDNGSLTLNSNSFSNETAYNNFRLAKLGTKDVLYLQNYSIKNSLNLDVGNGSINFGEFRSSYNVDSKSIRQLVPRVANKLTQSPLPPAAPQAGDLWIETTEQY